MRCYLCNEEIDMNNTQDYRITKLEAYHNECQADAEFEAKAENGK